MNTRSSDFQGQRDADSIEVKFLQSIFSLNDDDCVSSRLGYGSIYSLQMELKGRVRAFPVYGRSRIMDLVTWHGNPTHFLFFEHQTRCTWDVMEQPTYIHKLYNW
jgi:hypothetical protein